MSWGGTLFNPDPAAYLPHRFPFLMLDRLLELEPGVNASAERRVTTADGAFPKTLLLECIAQLGGIISAGEGGGEGFLASIDHAEFGDAVADGDTLTVTARVVKSFGRLCLVEGEAECDGRMLARARLTIGVGRICR